MIGHDQIEHAGLTDVGVKRPHNQDNLAIQIIPDPEQWREIGHLFLVADGMGGHAVGEKASEQAARMIPHIYSKHAKPGVPTAIPTDDTEANASIHAVGEQNKEFNGMGTTSTGLVILEDVAWLAHVGDSRAYRIREGMIQQLTYDHSYVWEYARRKHIDPSEVHDLPTNVIHRCLGPQPFVEVDIEGPHELQVDDIFVLCSDGLSGEVTDHEIGVIASTLPPREACRFLVDLANLRGGRDNITVIIVRVTEPTETEETTKQASPSKKKSRISWPVLALLMGILLAGGAIALKVTGVGGNALAGGLFAMAFVPCVVGLIGLIVHQQREQKARQQSTTEHETRIHRQASCELDETLVQKLNQACEKLKSRAEEMEWDPDYTLYDEHRKQAEQSLQAGELAEAFQELCRAMTPLCEAFQRHTSKEESFQPVWDKTH